MGDETWNEAEDCLKVDLDAHTYFHVYGGVRYQRLVV
jgi:hypothetical protein